MNAGSPEDGCIYSENPNTLWLRDYELDKHWRNVYEIQFYVPHSIFWNGRKVFEYSMVEDPHSTEYQDMFIYQEESTGYTYFIGDYQSSGNFGWTYGVCRYL